MVWWQDSFYGRTTLLDKWDNTVDLLKRYEITCVNGYRRSYYRRSN